WDDINRPVQIVHRRGTAAARRGRPGVGLDEAEQERRFTEMMLQERRRGFDLEAAPLLRLTIFRLGDDVYRLAWRFSHLILDGWSFGLLMGDFVTLYKAALPRSARRAGGAVPAAYLRRLVEAAGHPEPARLLAGAADRLPAAGPRCSSATGPRPPRTRSDHYADLRLGRAGPTAAGRVPPGGAHPQHTRTGSLDPAAVPLPRQRRRRRRRDDVAPSG
ncbi:hypothetical protein HCB18_27490, partial [Salinispora arenicola]